MKWLPCSTFSSVSGWGGVAVYYLPWTGVAVTLGRLTACLLPLSAPILVKACLFPWSGNQWL